MKTEILPHLTCPECLRLKSDLDLKIGHEVDGEVIEGCLICKSCKRKYPIADGIPNFIQEHPLQLIA